MSQIYESGKYVTVGDDQRFGKDPKEQSLQERLENMDYKLYCIGRDVEYIKDALQKVPCLNTYNQKQKESSRKEDEKKVQQSSSYIFKCHLERIRDLLLELLFEF